MATFGSVSATSELGAAGSGQVVVLSSTTSIDLKATGQTALYTVPAGKTAYITDVIVECSGVNTFVAAATVRVGKASAFTEFIAATALTGLSAAGSYVSLASAALLGVHAKFAATEVIKLDVTIGASATSITGTVHVIGFLI